MHSGNSSQNCTYMVRSGCKCRASVPKLHPNSIEASEGDDIVVSWQGDGRLLTNLETREANKQDGRPKKRSVRQEEDMLGRISFMRHGDRKIGV